VSLELRSLDYVVVNATLKSCLIAAKTLTRAELFRASHSLMLCDYWPIIGDGFAKFHTYRANESLEKLAFLTDTTICRIEQSTGYILDELSSINWPHLHRLSSAASTALAKPWRGCTRRVQPAPTDMILSRRNPTISAPQPFLFLQQNLPLPQHLTFCSRT
jgi:hypothetical protein